MAVYKCLICGAIYDEEKEGKPLSSGLCVKRVEPRHLQRIENGLGDGRLIFHHQH